MADEEINDQLVDLEAESKETKQSGGMLQWIIMVVVVFGCAGAGFGLSNLLATKQPINAQTPTDESISENSQVAETDVANSSEKTWVYKEMEALSVSLNDLGSLRHIRIKLNLLMSSEITQKNTAKLFEEKEPILRSWLNIYLSGMSVDDVRGEQNKQSMQMYILDVFNEKLFDKKKPLVKQILFEEFIVQ